LKGGIEVKREDVFARDAYRCVYCGQVCEAEALTLDHVQARVRGGDRSAGNLVTACSACNLNKGHRRLADFLRDEPVARANFFRLARHVWPRHLRAVREELERRGVAVPR
jgi:5-methylcytosine-specific restriction endonuclease McrA